MKPKRITKKAIQSVLRTGDRTQIFRMCYLITGCATPNAVNRFVQENAPTLAIYKNSYNIAFWGINRHKYPAGRHLEYMQANKYHVVVDLLRNEIARGTDNYTKRPMIHGGSLWFVSPFFGIKDYNGRYIMPVRGNERFCELICKLAEKYIPMHI